MGGRETLGELLGRRDRGRATAAREACGTGSSKGTRKPGAVR